jgi:uracil-DNA glycosylase
VGPDTRDTASLDCPNPNIWDQLRRLTFVHLSTTHVGREPSMRANNRSLISGRKLVFWTSKKLDFYHKAYQLKRRLNSIVPCCDATEIPTQIDFRLGDKLPRVILLGTCPGQAEDRANRPFAGGSHPNLETMLGWVSTQNSLFRSARVDDYTLMNAYGAALWKKRDDRSMPEQDEVLDEQNLDRLRKQLRRVGAFVVLGLGKTQKQTAAPQVAISALAQDFPHVQFYIMGHPSPKNIIHRCRGNGDPCKWAELTFERYMI